MPAPIAISPPSQPPGKRIRFLDEEEEAPGPEPAPPKTRLRFLDEATPAAGPQAAAGTPRLRFLDDAEGSEPTPRFIKERVEDVNYSPTLAEYRAYRKVKGEEDFDPEAVINSFVGAVAGVGETLYKGAAAVATDPELWVNRFKQRGTIAEAGVRGTADLGRLAQPVVDKLQSNPGAINRLSVVNPTVGFAARIAAKLLGLKSDESPKEFAARKAAETKGGRTPKQNQEEYEAYKTERDYQRFLVTRAMDKRRADAANGGPGLLELPPELVSSDVAEAGSLVLDATTLASFGLTAGPKALGKAALKGAAKESAEALGKDIAGAGAQQGLRDVGREVAKVADVPPVMGPTAADLAEAAAPGPVAQATGQALETVGKGAEAVGRGVENVAALPERAGRAAAEFFTDGAVAAEKGAEAAPSFVGGTVRGLAEDAKRIGRVGQSIGQAARAVGRHAIAGPTRWGMLESMSMDVLAPTWLRKAAGAARVLDPALGVARAGALDAATGSAVGGVLGGVSGYMEGGAGSAAEGLGAGLGSGGVMGVAGGAAGRLVSSGPRRMIHENADRARWLAKRTAEELAGIGKMRLNPDQMLRMADLERMAGDDVAVHFLTDDQFTRRFGTTAKGAQTVEGAVPTVYINTAYDGPRSHFHEMGHALLSLEGLEPQRQALSRTLFDQVVDGQVISKGLFSADDLVEFESRYRSSLGEKGKAAQVDVRGEVMAEAFTNLMAGKDPLGPKSGGVTRRIGNALLRAHEDSFLGAMRRRLHRMGVGFEVDGTASNLFFRDGQGITNSPEVNGALRDYMRAKGAQARRLFAADGVDPVHVEVRPGDLLAKGNDAIVRAFRDYDALAKDAQGNVRYQGGIPVLLTEAEIKKVQAARAEAMVGALERVTDDATPGAVRDAGEGKWAGVFFTDAQLAALERDVAKHILPPSIMAKIREINTYLRSQDGRQIVMEYNAALKNKKYSSGISMSTRAAVPIAIKISKAGNFVIDTLDVTHFHRKLQQWRKSKSKFFEPWGNDTDLFLRDVYTYLRNHQEGRPGSVGLDADAGRAVTKKDKINDFFNVPPGGELNYERISTSGDKDNLIRSRRMDRINRVLPGGGDPMPIRYRMQKVNYLPAGGNIPTRGAGPLIQPVLPQGAARVQNAFAAAPRESTDPGENPHAVVKHLEAQLVSDLAGRLVGLPPSAGTKLAQHAWDRAVSGMRQGYHEPRSAFIRRVADRLASISPQELAGLAQLALQDGLDPAKIGIERLTVAYSGSAPAA